MTRDVVSYALLFTVWLSAAQSAFADGGVTVTPSPLAFSIPLPLPEQPFLQELVFSLPVNYTASASTMTGGDWLYLPVPASFGAPLTALSVELREQTVKALGSGNYAGQIQINVNDSDIPIIVPVTLTIGGSPVFTVSPSSVSLTLRNQGDHWSSYDHVIVENNGGVALTGTLASVSTDNGLPWLQAVNACGGACGVTPGGPRVLSLAVVALGLAPGAHDGTITFTSPTGMQQVNVHLTVSSNVLVPSLDGLSFVSSGGMSPPSQTFDVQASGSPITFTATASAAAGGNWLSVASMSATTPATITVSVNASGLSPGAYAGKITLQDPDSLIEPVIIPVALSSVNNAPIITAVTNAASFEVSPVAPGELITIFGDGLGPAQGSSASLSPGSPAPTILSGTQVLFNGTAAPVIYSSLNQVSAVVPFELAGSTQTSVQIEYQGRVSAAVTSAVADASPGIFGVVDAGNQVIRIYATGGGQTDPAGTTGAIAGMTLLAGQLLPVTVQVNSEDATILYAGDAPGMLAGLFQVNARIPDGTAPGQAWLTLRVGERSTSPVRITINE